MKVDATQAPRGDEAHRHDDREDNSRDDEKGCRPHRGVERHSEPLHRHRPSQERRQERREHRPKCRACNAEDDAFGRQQTQETASARAEGCPRGQLRRSCGAAGQEQIPDVHRGDEQERDDHTKDDDHRLIEGLTQGAETLCAGQQSNAEVCGGWAGASFSKSRSRFRSDDRLIKRRQLRFCVGARDARRSRPMTPEKNAS